jgi:hypothetical protein
MNKKGLKNYFSSARGWQGDFTKGRTLGNRLAIKNPQREYVRRCCPRVLHVKKITIKVC